MLLMGRFSRGTTTLIDGIGTLLCSCWIILAGFGIYGMIDDERSVLIDFHAVIFFLLTLVFTYMTPDSPTMHKADVLEKILLYLFITAGVFVPLIDIAVLWIMNRGSSIQDVKISVA